MRYAFVSDVHGNLAAWRTVLSDLAVYKVDRIVCLGDVVGYGPQPAECLSSVYAHVHQLVLGNHDAVVGGRMDPSVFNDRARRVIDWTRRQLGEKAKELFSDLPLVLKGPGFRCVHGDFTDPGAFNYIFTEEDAEANFKTVSEQLLFCGHTHEACVFLTGESGTVYKIEPQDFSLEDGKRYIVNVGSVGSPRDGDPRASYVIFDEETKSVFFKRVPFDMEAFRAAVSDAKGLDPADVQLLRVASRHENEAIREAPDFSPGAKTRVNDKAAAKEADVEQKLRKSSMRWRNAAIFAAILALGLGISSATGIFKTDWTGEYPKNDPPPVFVKAGQEDCLPSFHPGTMAETGFGCAQAPSFSCDGWKVSLTDTRKQKVEFDANGRLVFVSSEPELEARLSAPAIICNAGEQIEVFAKAKGDGVDKIHIVGVLKQDGAEKTIFDNKFADSIVGVSEKTLPSKISKLSKEEGWKIVRGTVPKDQVPKTDGAELKISISGAFEGSVTIGAVSARLKTSSSSR